MMDELTIVLPFKGARRFWEVWAESESAIDFRAGGLEPVRCTACFAASELRHFLSATGEGEMAAVSDAFPDKGRFIELRVEARDTGGGFNMAPSGRGLVISGHGRNGLVNGIYEFLRMQGWRWTEPGEKGETPGNPRELKWPSRDTEIIPSFRYRGLDAFRRSHDSLEYLLWMARNGLNVCFRKAESAKFADKLGMYSRAGGHLLQKMLAPGRMMETGKTVWEEHPEWYGLPADGARARETATHVQLCVSAPGLVEYIGGELLKILSGPLNGVDILDLWGFDSWGRTCSCPACSEKGNGADQNLFLLSGLRYFLDRARAEGKLHNSILLDTAAYEGTAGLAPPENPVPENLSENGDICIFYPILRCYRHELGDPECRENSMYGTAVREWAGRGPGLSMWAGEYYNVSKYEDLPLLFSGRIPGDMRFYHAAGARGATYMHAPLVNWGMRSLTQLQHARYAWDVNTSDGEFLEDYFSSRYGSRAGTMRTVYEMVEEAGRDISAWRNWRSSLLSVLLAWDGDPPAEDAPFGHFESEKEAAAALRGAWGLQRKAAELLDRLIKEEREKNCSAAPQPGRAAVNPEEAEAVKRYDVLEHRMCESRRLMEYGLDTMLLMLLMLEYRISLRAGDRPEAGVLWGEIESVAGKMAMYYMPVKFENPGPGLVSPDALTRTQLRPVIARCRKARLGAL